MIFPAIRVAASLWLLASGSVLHAEPLPSGVAQRTFEIAGQTIEAQTYKPEGYAGRGLLVTLPGRNRNAGAYLRYSRILADRHGLLLVAPQFDRERFPTWRYQTGGIARYARIPDAEPLPMEPPARWTVNMLAALVEHIRREEGAPDLPYYFLGHSAGGQLLSRVAAFAPNEAGRIVIANPSTYVWPTREARFPFGFGGLPDALSNDEAIRRYLAQPVTIFLGTADVARDGALNVTEGAMRQGANRYERGRRAYEAGRALANERGWTFNWRLVEAPGVGHSARAMYASPAADAALMTD